MRHLLREFDRLTFAGRPDDSGIRGKGLLRPPYERSGEFPYDLPTSYGTPAAYDRGSAGKGTGGLRNPLVPKDTAHTAWDDVAEAMGVPFNVAMADNVGVGAGTGLPGADGHWANRPANPWDEDDRDAELSRFGESIPTNYTFDARTPEPEDVPHAGVPAHHDTTDDDLEKKVDRLFDRPDSGAMGDPGMRTGRDAPSDIMSFAASGFGSDPGLTARFSRFMGGLIPKEGAWDALAALFSGGSPETGVRMPSTSFLSRERTR